MQQLDKRNKMFTQEMSGCEATLHQILRILSQDENMHLNSQDKNALISSILENSMSGIEDKVLLPQHCRPRPVSHAERLQQTEINTSWNLPNCR